MYVGLETVPGHSVWMEVIASGGQPAAETQCDSVWISVLSLFTIPEYYIFFLLLVHLWVQI